MSNAIERANLAPSVHNTQPTRWRYDGNGVITLMLDSNRVLSIGDPEARDARLSFGAALEGTRLAFSEIGVEIRHMEAAGNQKWDRFQPILHLDCKPQTNVKPLQNAKHVDERFTWRCGFVPASSELKRALVEATKKADSLTVIDGVDDIAWFADMNDNSSLSFFRDRAYRKELISWIRFSPKDSRWASDGLSARALGMTRVEAIGAYLVLRSPAFEILDGMELAKAIISENEKTRTASAIALFHRPVEENPIESGVAYYQYLLALAAAGFSTWPMAVLADAEGPRIEISKKYGLPSANRLLNVLRVGVAPLTAEKNRARLSASTLMV
ncbi:MAG: hypothetical protein AAF362_02335 [Pseudomonadota bacterium]